MYILGQTALPQVKVQPDAANPLFVSGPNPSGLLEQGNIDLNRRPMVQNADGSISTVNSVSFNVDGKEVLVPRVSDRGTMLTEQQALEEYRKTGHHLGMFATAQDAASYAQALHEQQAKAYAVRPAVLPPPDMRTWMQRGADNRAAMADLYKASARVARFSDNFNAGDQAMQAAYDTRIAEVRAATGIDLADMNPARAEVTSIESRFGSDLQKNRMAMAKAFNARLQELAVKYPDKVGQLRPNQTVEQDALSLTAGAHADLQKARMAADKTGLGTTAGFMQEAAGSLSQMWRDPVQVMGLALGGGEISAARSLGARVLQRVLTDAAINGGLEAVVQSGSDAWRQKAGVAEPDYWTRVGLAAAFGGGLGGLFEGGSRVLSGMGRAVPEAEAALARVKLGEVVPADVEAVAKAVGVPLQDGELAALRRAAADDADGVAVLRPEVRTTDVTAALRAIETDAPLPRLAEDFEPVAMPAERPVAPDGAAMPAVARTEVPGGAPHVLDDPGYHDFVQGVVTERVGRIEQFVREIDSDIAHLQDGGPVDALPSGRTFPNVRSANDAQLRDKLVARFTEQKTRAEASLKRHTDMPVSDPALQIAYARRMGAREVIAPEARAVGEVNAPAAMDQAARALDEARVAGAPVADATITTPKTGTALDAFDGIPAGTDVEGNVIWLDHTRMKTWADRVDYMADIIAACKA
jgi:hypothetical protein